MHVHQAIGIVTFCLIEDLNGARPNPQFQRSQYKELLIMDTFLILCVVICEICKSSAENDKARLEERKVRMGID